MEYDDKYLTSNIEQDIIDKFENDAKVELSSLSIATNNEFYNILVRCRVYMSLASNQSEDEEMKRKYEVYNKEFERYLKLTEGVKDTINTLQSVSLYRG